MSFRIDSALLCFWGVVSVTNDVLIQIEQSNTIIPSWKKTIAYQTIELFAKNGNRHYQLLLGKNYQQGWFTPINPELSVHWIHLAAIQSDPEADYILSKYYETGYGGLSKDEKKAKAWRSLARQDALLLQAYDQNSKYFDNKRRTK